MTLEQIKYLREQLNKPISEDSSLPVANSVGYYLDNNVAFRNVGDFVIFDDEKEMIHCISANRHQFIKNESPFAIMSSSYEHLQFTEANLTLEGLTKALDEMFASLITEDQRKQIDRWAQNLPCKPLNPVKATYFKEENPRIPNKPVTVITRPDGVHHGYPVVNAGATSSVVKTTPAAKAAESIEKMEDGANLFISGEAALIDQNVTASNITITGTGTNSEGTMTVTGDNVVLKGISFTHDANVEKNENILKLNGENAVVEGCKFVGTAECSVGINGISDSVTFEDCYFDGAYGIYNGINLASNSKNGTSEALKFVKFVNCEFTKDFSNNNCVNMYGMADDAQVIFDNCTFEAGINTNPIRFGNETNGKNVTVTIKNCKYTKYEEHGEYDGLILFQDHTKTAVKEETGECQDFSTWTVNIINLIGVDGTKVTENGTGINRIYYCYGVNEGMEPVVNFS